MKISEAELNKNIRNLLSDDESITWTSIPKNRAALYEVLLVMIIPITFLTIIMSVQFIIFFSAIRDSDFFLPPLLIFLFADSIFIFVFFMIIYGTYHKSKTTRFILTNQRLLFTNREATLIKMQSKLSDIKEVKLYRSPTDKLVKVGDIRMTTSMGQMFSIYDIPEYEKTYQAINKIITTQNEEIKCDEFVRFKRCSYCGSSYFNDDNVCPYCGGH